MVKVWGAQDGCLLGVFSNSPGPEQTGTATGSRMVQGIGATILLNCTATITQFQMTLSFQAPTSFSLSLES